MKPGDLQLLTNKASIIKLHSWIRTQSTSDGENVRIVRQPGEINCADQKIIIETKLMRLSVVLGSSNFKYSRLLQTDCPWHVAKIVAENTARECGWRHFNRTKFSQGPHREEKNGRFLSGGIILGFPLSCLDLLSYTITLPAVGCDAPPTLSYTSLELASRVLLSSEKPA